MSNVSFGRRKARRLMCSSILFGAMAAAGSAHAQEATGQQATGDEQATQEIVVTAQFRSQKLQDTPIAITALTGDALEQRGASSLVDAAVTAPSVILRPAPSNFGSAVGVSIRGLGQNDFSPAMEPGVGIYIDDVYYPRLTGANFDLLDVDRIEILRGPQGTLTGKNSEGGAIKFVTRKPNGEDGGYLSATYGSRDRINLRGSADFTLARDLYARISGAFADQKGYVDVLDYGCVHPESGVVSTVGGANCKKYSQGDLGYRALRGILRYNPGDRLDIMLSGDYVKDERHAPATVLIYGDNTNPNVLTTNGLPLDNRFVCGRFCNYTTTGQPAASWVGTAIPELDGFPLSSSYGSELTNYESWGVSGNIALKLTDDITLTSITAYRSFTNGFADDNDLSPASTSFGYNKVDDDFFSQELRVNAKLADWADLTIGGYYSNEDARYYTLQDVRYAAVPLQFIGDDPITTKSKAVYGTVVVRPTEDLTLTGGLRYTKDDKIYTFFRHNYDNVTLNPFLPFNDTTAVFSGDRVDYRISADYRFSPALLVYGTVATGYKAGGVNPRPYNAEQVRGFGPEKVTSFEIGAKTDLFDRRLRVNVAAFYQDFKDAQLTLLSCPQYGGPGPCALPANAGNATMKGFEAELFARPVDGLQLDGSLSHIEWTWKCVNPGTVGLAPGSCSSDPAVMGLLSKTPAGVMPWKWTAGIQYEANLGDVGTLTPRVSVEYQGALAGSNLTPPPDSPSALLGATPAYTLVNAFLTWRNAKDDLSVTLEVTNLFDKYYYLGVFDLMAQGNGVISGTVGRPREWAVSIKKSF